MPLPMLQKQFQKESLYDSAGWKVYESGGGNGRIYVKSSSNLEATVSELDRSNHCT
jgi:hypothetical protein